MTDTLSLGFVSNGRTAGASTPALQHMRRKAAAASSDSRPRARSPKQQRSVPSIGSLVTPPSHNNVSDRNKDYVEKQLKQTRSRIDALTSQVKDVSDDADGVRAAVKSDLGNILDLTNVVYGKTSIDCPSAIIEGRAFTASPPGSFDEIIPAGTWCMLVYPMIKRDNGVCMKSKMVDRSTGQFYWVWVLLSKGDTRYIDEFSMVPM